MKDMPKLTVATFWVGESEKSDFVALQFETVTSDDPSRTFSPLYMLKPQGVSDLIERLQATQADPKRP